VKIRHRMLRSNRIVKITSRASKTSRVRVAPGQSISLSAFQLTAPAGVHTRLSGGQPDGGYIYWPSGATGDSEPSGSRDTLIPICQLGTSLAHSSQLLRRYVPPKTCREVITSRNALVGASWQRCRGHLMRDLLSEVPKGSREEVMAWVRTIFFPAQQEGGQGNN